MGRYSGLWASRQMVADPERFTRHRPPHGAQVAFSPVELQATAPETDMEGQVSSDAFLNQGVPAYPIDRSPWLGGRTHRWTRGMSTGGEGGVERTGPVGSGLPGRPGRQSVMMAQARARGRDFGAGVLATKAFEAHGPHALMFGEQRSTVLSFGLPTTPIANQGSGYEQYRRGLNSDPLNDGTAFGGPGTNPRPTAWRVGEDDGSLWRPARYLHTPMQRPFRPTRQLPTDQVQINPAHTPQIILSAPPPKVPSKGGDLFASLSKFIPKAVPVGGIARTPGAWYEPAQAAAEPADLGQLPDYSGVVNG